MELDTLHCRVEVPKGSRNKYEWDESLGAIRLDRFLFSSVSYPTDYGFVPDTLAEDGDPLDAMICLSAPTFPGCVIQVHAIALLRIRDGDVRDDKVVCVPHEDPNWNFIERLEQLPAQLQEEIEHFFAVYRKPAGRDIVVEGWHGRDEALQVIKQARGRWEAGTR